MDALGSLEEIAEQTSCRIDTGTLQRQTKCKWGRSVSPNLARSKVAREKQKQPRPGPEQISVAVEIAKPTAQAAQEINDADHVTSYTELIAGIQARLGELSIRQVDFDKLAGFADGLTGKVFGPSQVKRLGPEKLFDAIRAAGLRLRLEADPEQLERMRKQIAENCQPRQAKQARMGNHSRPSNKMIDDVLNYLANKKGGLTALNDAVKEARSNWARHAAKALWEKRRKLRRTGYLVSYREACLGSVSRIGDRQPLDSCAEEEATAA
jgi:hypothetical protein